MESPGHKARRKKNKGRSRYGPGRAERRKRQALSLQKCKGGLCRERPEGNRSHRCGVSHGGCGEWVTDLQEHCVQAHIPLPGRAIYPFVDFLRFLTPGIYYELDGNTKM
jgi:hypothetical protein